MEKPQTDFQFAKYKVLKFIITCVENDEQNGDYFDKDNNQLVIDAGHLLQKNNEMHEPSFWLFIPNRYHTDINCLWNW